METQVFKIPKISCGHCTRTIENELKEVAGVSSVTGNVTDKSVTVAFDAPASRDVIVATLKEINYPAAE